MSKRSTVSTFLWWSATWSALFRGYGLAALIYFVLDADLEPRRLEPLPARADEVVRLLEQPLEEAPLNQAIIQLLHGLHFKSGDGPVDGRIEIYSSETAPGEGAMQ